MAKKYIDSEKLIAEIERRREICADVAADERNEEVADYYRGKEVAHDEISSLITSLQQEQPELTQVPRIEQETQKKGWMDYGLLISEIGMHRCNAIDRIKETKERATEIKRNIAPHDLAILCEYLESVGAEIVLCCLQRYCMDFMFTQDEVKEILQQEQPEVDLEKEIKDTCREYRINDHHEQELGKHDIANIAYHFFNLGLNARKEE